MIRILKNLAHLLIALGANIFYRFPSRSMKVIGVTGTDGKTTTASLIYDILRASGKKTALLTTVSAIIDGESYDTGFHVTTPNSFALQKYITLAKKKRVEYFVLETTSHGLDQNRVYGIHFAVSVITNISREHLDYHHTYEKYVKSKAKIIGMSEIVILNKDDKSYDYISNLKIQNSKSSFQQVQDPEFTEGQLKNQKYITFGLKEDSDINPEKYPLKPSMAGEFNLYNSMAALGVCLQLGIEYDEAKNIIEKYIAPKGRQDILQKVPFTVMVDFAHTPNSFKALLSLLRVEHSGKIIHVFGSAGERDHGKRPEMGKISSQFADVIVLTAEDPRGEKVEEIITDIKKGIQNPNIEYRNSKQIEKTQASDVKIEKDKKYLFEIPDRKDAIEYALSIAQKGDIVVITGKGHEESMNFGEGEFEWSDHEVVKKALTSE